MIYLRFNLTLRSPAIVSTLSGDPNNVATQPFIPGSALRGAVAARLLASGEDGESALFKRLVLSGAVRYLHAYPTRGGTRTWPTPLSWKRLKGKDGGAYDLASFTGEVDEEAEDQTDVSEFEEFWPQDALASISEAFITSPSVGGTLAQVKTGARIHQQRDRVKGRSWTDKDEQPHGTIFSYTYLEAGQTFSGVIQVAADAADDIERLKKLLEQPILVGRSRRAGYGGEAKLNWRGEADREFTDLRESVREDIPEGERFRVMLTSAYVGRHPQTGQIDPTALDHELNEVLGGAATIEHRRWAFETVGGFNRKWALETPQVMAVRGGSVLVLRATQPLEWAKLEAVEHAGLGERRAEGFGRLVFLWHSGATDVGFKKDEEKEDLPNLPAGSAHAQHEQVQFLETRLMLTAARAELDRVAQQDLVQDAAKLPTSSLLGRLRGLVRGVLDEQSASDALKTLHTWCGQGKTALKEIAQKQLRACTLGKEQQLLGWLTAIAASTDTESGWAALLKATGSAASMGSLAEKHYLTDQSTAQAILEENAQILKTYLIDAVLTEMTKKNRKGEA